jgi:hypothetical protein
MCVDITSAKNVRIFILFKEFNSDEWNLMTVLFMFLDGVGLGSDDATVNPFVLAEMPNLRKLLQGQKLLKGVAPFSGERASLFSIDACLGVGGLPQSATGQATFLTGRNVPSEIGYHYGPKPDKNTAAFLQDGGIFGVLTRNGKKAALVNAYPPGYFQGIQSGKRLYSSIPLALTNAGLSLKTSEDLLAGRAISADFTARGWRERLQMPEMPEISLDVAGKRLKEFASLHDFTFFEYWLTDHAGHGQNLKESLRLLSELDTVLGGLLKDWDDKNLILITSDHGNLEDLSTRRHTYNPVPLFLVGDSDLRRRFQAVTNLAGVFHALLDVFDLAKAE